MTTATAKPARMAPRTPPPTTIEGLRPIADYPEHQALTARITEEEAKLAAVEKELRALANSPFLKVDAVSAEVARRVAGREAEASPGRHREELQLEAEIGHRVLSELRQRLASLEVSLSARQRPTVAPLEAEADREIEERLTALVEAVEKKAQMHEQVQRLGYHTAALDGSTVRGVFRNIYVEAERLKQRKLAAATVGQ